MHTIPTACDPVRRDGLRPVVYTSRRYWRAMVGDSRECSDLPLWAAQYDGDPGIDTVIPFGAWTIER